MCVFSASVSSAAANGSGRASAATAPTPEVARNPRRGTCRLGFFMLRLPDGERIAVTRLLAARGAAARAAASSSGRTIRIPRGVVAKLHLVVFEAGHRNRHARTVSGPAIARSVEVPLFRADTLIAGSIRPVTDVVGEPKTSFASITEGEYGGPSGRRPPWTPSARLHQRTVS